MTIAVSIEIKRLEALSERCADDAVATAAFDMADDLWAAVQKLNRLAEVKAEPFWLEEAKKDLAEVLSAARKIRG
jgi:hypothetical protein